MAQNLLCISHAKNVVQKKPRKGGFAQTHWVQNSQFQEQKDAEKLTNGVHVKIVAAGGSVAGSRVYESAKEEGGLITAASTRPREMRAVR